MTTISIKLSPELANIDEKEIFIEIDGKGVLSNQTRSEHRDAPVFAYFEDLIQEMLEYGRKGTADNYRCAEANFRRFCRTDPAIRFSKLDTAFISRYEEYLYRRRLRRTTISFYMRTLRAMYNMAVRDGMTVDNKPFKNVYTSIGQTPKRGITINDIKEISKLFVRSQAMAPARDLFLFSFYTRGMPFVDMAYLKKTDLKNGVLTYRRKKTGQKLAIKWEPCMQDIVDMHPSTNNIFLLPIITDPKHDLRQQYKNRQRYINERLGKIGERLQLETRLTMYVARHSWASIAKEIGIPVSVISEALGHTSLKTTQIYLKSISAATIDNANLTILKKLMK